MAYPVKPEIRYTSAIRKKKVKAGGSVLVSRALVKKGASNLIPGMHVKRSDTVIVISGSKKSGQGKTGKVLNVFPQEGKIIVEGVNMMTHATRGNTAAAQRGLNKKEEAIFASRVMLYCTACKKPTRIKHKMESGQKKVRICRHCQESLDT